MTSLFLSLLLCTTSFGEPIRVGVDNTPPFSYQDKDGSWAGISVEAWEHIARDSNLESEFVDVTGQDPFASLENGNIDVLIPAITMTAAREQKFDSSHAYYRDHVAVANVENTSNWRWLAAFSGTLIKTIGVLFGILSLAGTAFWWYEREKKNLKEGEHPGFGIPWHDTPYWAATVMMTVGSGDIVPKTHGGKLVTTIWTIVGPMFMVSWVGNAVLNAWNAPKILVSNVSELTDYYPTTLAPSTSAEILEAEGISFRTVDKTEDLLKVYRAGDWVVYDESVLKSLKLNPVRLEDTPSQYYAFYFREGDTRIGPVNFALLQLLESSSWSEIKNTNTED